MGETLDYFMSGVLTQDTKQRIETGEDLKSYLSNGRSSLNCDCMDKLVDGLAIWINSSSAKVSLTGLEVTQLLIGRMNDNFRPFVTSVLSAVIDRLGDNKDQVREKARDVLLDLMNPGSTPQYVAERLTHGFTHKVWKVREETLRCIQCALKEWGSKCFVISKLVPQVVKLLDDPSSPVRDQAVMTLVEFYKHVGERLKNDLNKRENISSRLGVVLAKMDDVRNSGQMIVHEAEDALDGPSSQSIATKKSKSVISGRCQSVIPRLPINGNHDKGLAAGALDEEGFIRSFVEVPRITVSSPRDISDKMSKIRDTLSDTNKDWEKRQDALKEIRSIVINVSIGSGEFQSSLRTCVPSLRTSVLDLRSQIVREACVTLAFLSREMGRDFEYIAEMVIPALVQLLQNSAKIMSSSGFTALKFIVQNTHSPRLVPHITCNLNSKSTVIRRQCCELMELMLRIWPTNVLEKQLNNIQETIKKGLNDADPEAKVHSRRAFWNFEENFKQQASTIFSGLEPSQQKLLNAAQTTTNGCSGSSSSSSTCSINVHSNSAATTRTFLQRSKMRSPSADRVRHQIGSSRPPQSNVRQGQLPQRSQHNNNDAEDMQRSNSTANLTSSSRIARPASGNNNSNNNNNFNSLRHSHSSSDLSTPAKKPPVSKPLRRNASMRLPRSARISNAEARYRKSPNPLSSSSSSGLEARHGRSPKHGSSSQPSSRSVSPSSRYSYISQHHHHYLSNPNDTQQIGFTQRSNKVINMREPSPSRSDAGETTKRRVSAAPIRVPLGNCTAANWSVASELDGPTKNLVRRSVNIRKPQRVETSDVYGGLIGEEDKSESSSLSSDHSGKFLNSEDVSQVIGGLLSGSWMEKRESLIHLQAIFQNHKQLGRPELKRVMESFERLFYDHNNKVFPVFLDTLVHFISTYKNELGDWVSTCLPMLLEKLGSEEAAHVQTKIQKVLDNIRVFFPAKIQFETLAKFMVNQMKNSSIGVKLSVLGYLHELTLTLDSRDITNTSNVRLAITRVITCSTEPKSPEIRKVSTIVFIRLYQLNPELFRSMLGELPLSFQDSAKRILQENSSSFHHGDDDDDDILSLGIIPSPSPSPNMFDGRQRSPSSRPPIKLNTSDSENINPMFTSNNHNNNIISMATTSALTAKKFYGSPVDAVRPPLDPFNPKITDSPKRNGRNHVDAMSDYDDDDEMIMNGSHDYTISKSLLAVDKDIFSEAFSFHQADITSMENEGGNYDYVQGDDDDDDDDDHKPDEIDIIIQELAYKNERVEDRKYKLIHLIVIARDKNNVSVWEHHSKTILMLLLDILKNDLEVIREMSLKVIVELVYNHMSRFVGHEELILSSVIEARKDPSQAVASTAQDSALIIAALFPVHQSINIIMPFIAGTEPLTRLLAFRIQLSVIETVSDSSPMKDLLPVVIPGLLKGYDDQMSAIRKDSVFTLVRIYLIVGDELKPYLKDMCSRKLKLLNLYIKRALALKEKSTLGT